MKKNKDGLTEPQEKACQEYIKNGGNLTEAHRIAYPNNMSDKTRNEAASRLFGNSKILARIEQLQKNLIEEFNYSVKNAVKELDEVLLLAKADKQYSSAVSAIGKKIDMFGLDAPKEIKHSGSVVFIIEE